MGEKIHMKYETIESRGKVYQITSRDQNGRINGLRRYNEKAKMWVNMKFNNGANVDEIDEWAASLLGNKKHYILK